MFCVPQDCRQFRQQIERPSSHDLVAPFESIDCDSCSFAAGAARATCNAQRVAWRRRFLNLLQIILSNSPERETLLYISSIDVGCNLLALKLAKFPFVLTCSPPGWVAHFEGVCEFAVSENNLKVAARYAT